MPDSGFLDRDHAIVGPAMMQAHFEGFAGCYAIGWVVPAFGHGHCRVRFLDEHGLEVAAGVADQMRTDLASAGFDRHDHGFCVALPDIASRGMIWAEVNGVTMPGSPRAVGPGCYDGHITVERGCVTGWVTERCQTLTPPEVEISGPGGALLCRVKAVAEAGAYDPACRRARFSVPLDAACFGSPDYRLTASIGGRAFAETNCTLALQGHLETATEDRCIGWLLSPDAPDRAFDIEIYLDGVLAGRTKTDVVRDDVRARFPAARCSGFDVWLRKPPFMGTTAAVLSLRFPGSTQELFGGPYVVGGRAALVAAAREVARAALVATAEPAARFVAKAAIDAFLAEVRAGDGRLLTKPLPARAAPGLRMTIVVPCYKGADITRQCLESVLQVRDPALDRVLIINDCSPEAAMAPVLSYFADEPNVEVLTNSVNLGFVRTVNRALDLIEGGDVLLLNADTVLFPGVLDEMHGVLQSSRDIGSVTPLSNIATIFSYPHERIQVQALPDMDWPTLAAAAAAENRGVALDVPTGHGFCLLLRGDLLAEVGRLDEAFGRGYGEENDFCARASDLGYRHVLAAGAFVQHRESVSFGDEKAALISRNLARLNKSYPEYHSVIMDFVERDGIRRARWALDAARMRAVVQGGGSFALVVTHSLGGGTSQALRDLEQADGYGGATRLLLSSRANGMLELQCDAPEILAVFAPDELGELFGLLDAGSVEQVKVHQLLGFSVDFIECLAAWVSTRDGVFYAHDFYSLCPRVTMVDAFGSFCDVAAPPVCARCVERGGAHENSRLDGVTALDHRVMFGRILGSFRSVICPSDNAAGYLRRVFPDLPVTAQPHPEREAVAYPVRPPNTEEVVLFGAIGAHKGSAFLLDLAKRATLTQPHLRFRVIGYTNIDAELLAVGNVAITGRYDQAALPGLVAEARGQVALFVHRWPETFSYTLSEAMRYGFVPIVPDVGAPADRVRAAGYGLIYPLGLDVESLLQAITAFTARLAGTVGGGGQHHPGSDGADWSVTTDSFEAAV